MSATETTSAGVSARAPRGCSSSVMTQVTPDERRRLENIAQAEGRSLSATVRLLMLRGIQGYADDTLNPQ
ncbi:hypothetical protein [Halomonas elongata]|uniref:hypothetical protein n=1 Tax=Halomonas elongata TaxID=2746 RepID=UPI0023B1D1BA|nr:hypothetical protein [Halomonas elongata]